MNKTIFGIFHSSQTKNDEADLKRVIELTDIQLEEIGGGIGDTVLK